LKILHIDTGAEMRGGQHQVLLLCSLLTEAGHDITLLAKEGSPLSEQAKQRRLTVKAATLPHLWRESLAADVVHAHDARAHTLTALAAQRPVVVSRRVAFPVKRTWLSRLKYSRPARYLAVSQFVAHELESVGVSSRRIDIVHDAVPDQVTGTWDPTAPAVALASGDPLKGRDLVEQASKLSGIHTIFSDNLPQNLKRASMFVYITRTEGLGSAALLAMQAGIPVVASRVGGLAEVFIDGVSGLYTANDPARISGSMLTLLQTPGLAQQIIAAAKQRINDQFSARILLTGTVEAYRRAIAG
jgi:hypothetical protein